MRPDVALAFDRTAAAARREAGLYLIVTSGYRSDAEQARLFAQYPDPKWVAPPARASTATPPSSTSARPPPTAGSPPTPSGSASFRGPPGNVALRVGVGPRIRPRRSGSTLGRESLDVGFRPEVVQILSGRGKPLATVVEASVSVLEQFRSAEERVAERLRELKPLVEEYQALEQVAQRLGLNVNEDQTAPEKQRSGSPGGTPRRRRGSKTGARSAGAARRRSSGAAAAKRAAATTQPRRPRPSQRSRDDGPPGSNRSSRRQQDVLRLVSERPGITVRQIAKELGVDPTGLYRPVHKLEQDGAISKQGAALRPVK
jgi:MarR family